VLGFVLLVLAATLAVKYELSPINRTGHASTFEVRPGWGALRISQALARQGLVRNAKFFTAYLRFRGIDREIGEGLYDLSPAMSAPQIAHRLEQGGRPLTVTVVIPEGWRASQIVARLVATDFGDAHTLDELIQHPGELRPSYVPQGNGLEGYLFPASYRIPVRSTPAEVIKMMLERFNQEITGNVVDALKARHLTVNQWVILASMVQAEAGKASEMPIIAGVFLNRLDQGMPLQSDPTVAYGLNESLQQLNRFAGDFQKDTPYNTYIHPGLPPGPIDNPGHAALQAVLNPQRDGPAGKAYLYFLHTPAGKFIPNVTLQAHEKAVQEYLR
jgi:UPF0755 protein